MPNKDIEHLNNESVDQKQSTQIEKLSGNLGSFYISSTESNHDKFHIVKLKARGCNVLRHHIRCIDDAHVRYRLE